MMMGLDVIGAEGDCLPIGGQRFIGSTRALQRDAQIVMRLGPDGLELSRRPGVIECFRVSAQQASAAARLWWNSAVAGDNSTACLRKPIPSPGRPVC
jgi:hypothetical protein